MNMALWMSSLFFLARLNSTQADTPTARNGTVEAYSTYWFLGMAAVAFSWPAVVSIVASKVQVPFWLTVIGTPLLVMMCPFLTLPLIAMGYTCAALLGTVAAVMLRWVIDALGDSVVLQSRQ